MFWEGLEQHDIRYNPLYLKATALTKEVENELIASLYLHYPLEVKANALTEEIENEPSVV